MLAMTVLRRFAATYLALAVGTFTVFDTHAGTDVPARTSQAWSTFVDEFIEATFAARPSFAVWAGRHEYDGRLSDWSAASLQKENLRLHAARERALAFQPEALDVRQRFERDYVVAAIDRDLFWNETAEWPYRNPMYYGRALDPDVYISREYAPLAARMRAYIAYANAVPAAAQQIRKNLRTPLPRPYVHIGHVSFGGLARFYQNDVPAVFAAVHDAQLQQKFRAANARAIKAMQALDAWFTQLEASATDNFALGERKFTEMLRATEQVDVPLARLKEVGERDLARNLAALREACQAFMPDTSMESCVAKVKANKLPGTPVDGARQQLTELRQFVLEKKIVTIPGSEQALVKESPPYQRWNAAYISVSGPYEKRLPSIYYIAPPDPKWTQAEQEAYLPGQYDLLFISAHEVWPGHFLQHQHANRTASKLGQLFSSYAFGEGWAHYAEEMMWQAGLEQGNSEAHIGQLLNALLRDARYLSAIGLHTGGMSVADAEKLFREKAYQDGGSARQQAARGTFDPAYGNYTLGKLMIMKLREDWTATRGGRTAWQDFHDAFLSYGSPPIPLLRRAMLGENMGGLL